VHSLASLIKISVLLATMILITRYPYSRLSLPGGLIFGGILSWLFLQALNTKPKASYILSYGILIKFLVWILLMWFAGTYSFILLFFDPMLEALLRFISNDRLFIPLTAQHPELKKHFRERYQAYMELPVLSVISPLFKWLF
jgi:hypothetical protein